MYYIKFINLCILNGPCTSKKEIEEDTNRSKDFSYSCVRMAFLEQSQLDTDESTFWCYIKHFIEKVSSKFMKKTWSKIPVFVVSSSAICVRVILAL